MAKTRTPRKGGRNKRIGTVCTEEVEAKFRDVLARTGESGGDLLDRLIKAEWEAQYPPEGWVIRAKDEYGSGYVYYQSVNYNQATSISAAKVFTTQARAEASLPHMMSFTAEVLPYRAGRDLDKPWEKTEE